MTGTGTGAGAGRVAVSWGSLPAILAGTAALVTASTRSLADGPQDEHSDDFFAERCDEHFVGFVQPCPVLEGRCGGLVAGYREPSHT